jgi:hypothetical protein
MAERSAIFQNREIVKAPASMALRATSRAAEGITADTGHIMHHTARDVGLSAVSQNFCSRLIGLSFKSPDDKLFLYHARSVPVSTALGYYAKSFGLRANMWNCRGHVCRLEFV